MHSILLACQLALALGAVDRGAPGTARPAQRRAQPRAAQPAPAQPSTALPKNGPPKDASPWVTTDAGVVVPDLRALVRELASRKSRLEASRVGRAYYAPPGPGEQPVVDVAGELAGLLALADAGSGPVPARVTFVDDGDTGITWQLAVKTDGGFAERARARANGADAPLGLRAEGERFSVEIAGGRVPLLVTADGWLRASPREAVARTQLPPHHVGPRLARWAEGDLVDVYVVRARLPGDLVRALEDAKVAPVLATMRELTIGLAMASDGSSRLRFCIDADALVQLGAALRRSDLDDRLTPGFGPDATAFATIAVPPALMQGFVAAADKALVESGGPAMPEALASAVARADGRLGLVSFGWPGDVALGIGMQDPASAAALVPALGSWLRGALEQLQPTLADVIGPPGATAGLPPSFVLHPDPALTGVRVGAVGSNVVVAADEGRLSSLARAAASGGAAPVAGPLTPMVRATVARPAIATGYAVASGDGMVGTFGAWAARLLEVPARAALARLPPWLRATLRRLPLAAALAGVESLTLYDLAFSLDVSGPVLVFEASSSEL